MFEGPIAAAARERGAGLARRAGRVRRRRAGSGRRRQPRPLALGEPSRLSPRARGGDRGRRRRGLVRPDLPADHARDVAAPARRRHDLRRRLRRALAAVAAVLRRAGVGFRGSLLRFRFDRRCHLVVLSTDMAPRHRLHRGRTRRRRRSGDDEPSPRRASCRRRSRPSRRPSPNRSPPPSRRRSAFSSASMAFTSTSARSDAPASDRGVFGRVVYRSPPRPRACREG